jgi:cytochrome c oxidase subunit IV
MVTTNNSTSNVQFHPGYATFIRVWVALLLLTALLVTLSRLGQTAAVWGLLTLTPLKAGLVFYFFMHLRYEGPLLKAIVLVTLGTLLVFLALLFSDVAFRGSVPLAGAVQANGLLPLLPGPPPLGSAVAMPGLR